MGCAISKDLTLFVFLGMNGMAVFSPVTSEPIEIGLVIGVVKKGLAPLIAAHDDVVEESRSE